MEVKNLASFVVGNPPPHYGGRYFIFVKITTACGIHGYGECYAASFAPNVMVRAIEDVFERHLLGADPHDIETFWHKANGSGFSGRPDPTMMGCVSALEMACWDIVGKAADRPVHKLLGGRVRERLRTYTYLYPQEGSVIPAELENEKTVYNDPNMAAEAAVRAVKEGFTAVKFDPAKPYTVFDGHMSELDEIEHCVSMVAAVREAVGTKADILFGTHGQFTPAGAVRLAQALEPHMPLWFEEPVPPGRPDQMAEIAGKTTIPIAAGERLCTHYEFAELLKAGGASILQPDLGRSGGLLDGRKIAAHGEVYGALIAPHCYCGPIVGAANIQLSASIPNFLILESIRKWDGFHAELLQQPLCWKEGYVVVSDRPGLGVELNEEIALAHSWDPAGPLHLESGQAPRHA